MRPSGFSFRYNYKEEAEEGSPCDAGTRASLLLFITMMQYIQQASLYSNCGRSPVDHQLCRLAVWRICHLASLGSQISHGHTMGVAKGRYCVTEESRRLSLTKCPVLSSATAKEVSPSLRMLMVAVRGGARDVAALADIE